MGDLPTKGELTGVHRGNNEYFDVYYEYDSFGNKTAESVPTDQLITPSSGSGAVPGGVSKTSWSTMTGTSCFPRRLPTRKATKPR